MAWAIVIGSVAGAGLGALKNAEERKQIAALNAAEAEKTRYSPWTGMKGQIQASPSAFGDVLQGGMTGAMMGKQFGGFGSGGAEAAKKMDTAANMKNGQMGGSAYEDMFKKSKDPLADLWGGNNKVIG